MLKIGLMTLAAWTVSQSALAQPAGSGGYLQQIPPPPAAPKAQPDILLQQAEPVAPTAGADGARVRGESLRVTGATLFPEAVLVEASGFRPGEDVTLAQLRIAASKITAFYNARGYFVAKAYLPPQDINDGVVTIAVVEGRYGDISVSNHTRLSPRVVGAVLSGLETGDPVAGAPLDRRLLLLSDIPGVRLRSTLSPGAAAGTSDLLVDLTPGKLLTGSLEADNAGNRYTGEYRAGGTLNINNPTGHGDLVNLRALTSGEGLSYLRAAYETRVGVAVLGASFADVRYRLGEEFSVLDADGSAQIASLYGAYPVIRSRRNNLTLSADLSAKRFEDNIGAANSTVDKEAVSVTAGLDGDRSDPLGGGGWMSYSLAVTVGRLDIETPGARAADAATARTQGRYGKVAFAADRLQNLPGPFSLYGSVRGQLASTNLDISEKMELGGAYGVRAYPEGEGYGDQGYIATVEGRWLLPWARLQGRLQLFGFADAGEVQLVRSPWVSGDNRLSRSGVGVGAVWAQPGNFLIKATYAHRLGSPTASSGADDSGRVWVQVVKLF